MLSLEDKVLRLAKEHNRLDHRVDKMEVIQSGLVEAVKSVKVSVDNLNSRLVWMCNLIVGSVWAAVVIGLITRYVG